MSERVSDAVLDYIGSGDEGTVELERDLLTALLAEIRERRAADPAPTWTPSPRSQLLSAAATYATAAACSRGAEKRATQFTDQRRRERTAELAAGARARLAKATESLENAALAFADWRRSQR